MLYSEIIVVCSEIYLELLNVHLAVHIVTTGLYMLMTQRHTHTLSYPLTQ